MTRRGQQLEGPVLRQARNGSVGDGEFRAALLVG
jgi:hypothetical protein